MKPYSFGTPRRAFPAARGTHGVPFLALALLALAAVGPTPASAEMLQISGTTLVEQCPCQSSQRAVEEQGVLKPQGPGRFFGAVTIPNGLNVCGFAMVYRDVNNAESMTGYLVKKPFGVGNSNGVEVVMAEAVSGPGVTPVVRRSASPFVRQPTVNTSSAFYYVRVNFTNINQELLGLQLDVRQVCPG